MINTSSTQTSASYNISPGLQKIVVGAITVSIVTSVILLIANIISSRETLPMSGVYLWLMISSTALPIVLFLITFAFHPTQNLSRLNIWFTSLTIGTAAWWLIVALLEIISLSYSRFFDNGDYISNTKLHIATTLIGVALYAGLLAYLRISKRWQ